MKEKILFLIIILSFFIKDGLFSQELSKKYYQGIYALQPKETVYKKHLQINLNFVYVTNEVYFNEFGGEISFFYNFLENMNVGLGFTQYKGYTTSFYRDVQKNFDIFPERVMNQYSFDAYYGWNPVYGKFIIFGNSLINFKASLVAGVGILKTSTKSFHPSGKIGVLLSFGINKFLVFSLGLMDQMYYENYTKEGAFKNQLILNAGFGFLFSL